MKDSSVSLLEYAGRGASAAARAIARVVERDLQAGVPRCEKVELGALPSGAFPQDERVVAIFADLVGAMTGRIGIVLSRSAADGFVRVLVGCDAAEVLPERARSAICELGNIALSAAAGAIADLAGGVVIPSVPQLCDELDGAAFLDGIQPELERLPAYVAHTDLVDHGGSLHLCLVWIPGD